MMSKPIAFWRIVTVYYQNNFIGYVDLQDLVAIENVTTCELDRVICSSFRNVEHVN